jgi:hypothetical protein
MKKPKKKGLTTKQLIEKYEAGKVDVKSILKVMLNNPRPNFQKCK